MPDIDDSARCPCGTGLTYGDCCGPFLSGAAQAPTAERTMRSRFTAYSVGNPAYLIGTWHPSTRPTNLTLDPELHWISLDILGRTRGGMLDNEGTVNFRATYRSEGMRMFQQENSRFVREIKTWFYVDGTVSN